MPNHSTQSSVVNRYADAAYKREAELCCPVEYNGKYLEKIPVEVIEKDYGCGDPSRWIQPGETVLDLGSGTGKICFIASQIVGRDGRVIGVDMTHDMLEVARRNAPVMAERLGYANTEFKKGRIEDLTLDLDLLEDALKETPIGDLERYFDLEAKADQLREEQPLVASGSIDVVVSNCVLNLVNSDKKEQLFREIFRVLEKGGRAVISDIVSDEPVPEHMQRDTELWSGCISGALTEEAFLKAFEDAGFYAMEYVKFETEPWRTVEGIEFRSVTIRAYKGKQDDCKDHNQAVIYLGPFNEIVDDDGHRFRRGERTAVCDKTFQLLQGPAYAEQFAYIEPAEAVSPDQALAFSCHGNRRRDPWHTKGGTFAVSNEKDSSCLGSGCC